MMNRGKMAKYHINIFYSGEDGGYIADIPDLEHCSAFGDTPDTALKEALIAEKLWFEEAKASKNTAGLLGKYANPSLICKEDNAWQRAVKDNKVKKDEVVRMCCVCRQRKAKSELIKVVKRRGVGDAALYKFSIVSGYEEGRGAYICNDKNCIDIAIKKRALNRSFKCEVDKEIYLELEKSLDCFGAVVPRNDV